MNTGPGFANFYIIIQKNFVIHTFFQDFSICIFYRNSRNHRISSITKIAEYIHSSIFDIFLCVLLFVDKCPGIFVTCRYRHLCFFRCITAHIRCIQRLWTSKQSTDCWCFCQIISRFIFVIYCIVFFFRCDSCFIGCFCRVILYCNHRIFGCFFFKISIIARCNFFTCAIIPGNIQRKSGRIDFFLWRAILLFICRCCHFHRNCPADTFLCHDAICLCILPCRTVFTAP